ncbi:MULTISPECIES: SDR family oxidoreductase [Pararhizobium]|jgi:NAD(P)-dependent dehydrogenase (short-subunit alcohol dehydrogenase family)|uniref:SDR family oxidoreductase n=1 Tax=Pararhizobium TaxID=1612611 RepID=UPI0023E34660|nr:SDR family oxidoreductase [Pararhizobium qamdonense]
MSRLLNKTALITGGTSGIGLETARQFIAEGARVAVTGTNPATIETARAVLGDTALFIQANAGDVAGQKAVVEAVKSAFGHLDILFVNAGAADFRPIEAFDEEAFDRSVAINVKGPFFLIQALLPVLSNPASIVLNTSINAHIGMPNTSVYALTKAALLSFAKTLSGELIGRGIRVNAVSPGPVATPLYGKLGMSAADTDAMAAAKIPAGRFGTPGEIARAVVFLASDESAYTVGSELIIDGGMSNL